MRPHEIDVTLRLYYLKCKKSEDSGGDEPYMWILGFKVDADTMRPKPGSLIPDLGVQVFKGAPAFTKIMPGSSDMDAGEGQAIQAALGTRSFRLKPANVLGQWFPGLAGIVSLLWDNDNFDPSTHEAGHKKFNELFGPALSNELNNVFNGDYDDPLSRDANGNPTPFPPNGPDFTWRLGRLRDAAGRKNAVKAITGKVKDQISGGIRDALSDAAGWDEKLDIDELLGVDAQVFLGDELLGKRDFELRFTDEGADYTALGFASGARVHVARLESVVTRAIPTFERFQDVKVRVCWWPEKMYMATAERIASTTRYTLSTIIGSAPVAVRWFLDDAPLTEAEGSLLVTFEPIDAYEAPPQDVLAKYYPGGPGLLTYKNMGTILEISYEGGMGAFNGTVRALYAFEGDPSLFPPVPPQRTTQELLALGYELADEVYILGVDLRMNQEYEDDIKNCKRIVKEIDRKRIPVNWGKLKVTPGDPPPYRQQMLDRVANAVQIAEIVGLDIAPEQLPLIRGGSRGRSG